MAKFSSLRKSITQLNIPPQNIPATSGNALEFFYTALYIIERIYSHQVLCKFQLRLKTRTTTETAFIVIFTHR